MTPAKLAKIRAIANDSRGDPATRAIARRMLQRYAAEPPPKFTYSWHDLRHPGMRTSAEYDHWRFMQLDQWSFTRNGNRTFFITVKGRSFQIVLFKHKKRPTHGWMRVDTITDQVEFSGAFATQREAQEDAWKTLQET